MKDIYVYENNMDKYRMVNSIQVLRGNINNPEITIFIPTFKRIETLELSVESAIKQKGNINYEIIIIDNNPDEINGKTKELLESFHSEKVYYYVNNENIGLCGNWNRGVELARGKYVSMIHDDDILSPYFLTSILTTIKEKKYPGLIGVDYIKFNSGNLPTFTEPKVLRYRNVTKKSFFFGKYINIAGMTIKRELLLDIGGYSEDYYPNEDTNLIYQSLMKEQVVNIEYPLAGYRYEMNLSLSEETMKKIILIMEETRRNIAKYEPFAKTWLDKFDKEYLYLYIIGANLNWGLNIDYKNIFRIFKINEKKPNYFKIKFMQLLIKIQLRLG